MKILILEGLYGNNKGKKCQWKLKRTNLKVGDMVVLNCHDWKIIKVIGEKKRNIFPKGTIFSECSTGFGDNEVYKILKGLKSQEDEKRWAKVGRMGEKKEKKVNENDFNRKMLGIYFDSGIDDYGCTVGYRVDMDGNIKIEKIKYFKPPKEVKKVRPYFETKVVKVKKEEKGCKHEAIIDENYINGDTLRCIKCGKKFLPREVRGEKAIRYTKKGNWVNGENLDEIKFPCFCRYSKDRYGIITKTYIGEAGKEVIYTMHHADKQYFSMSSVKSYNNLERLIKAFGVHILKGKIIIFEEK